MLAHVINYSSNEFRLEVMRAGDEKLCKSPLPGLSKQSFSYSQVFLTPALSQLLTNSPLASYMSEKFIEHKHMYIPASTIHTIYLLVCQLCRKWFDWKLLLYYLNAAYGHVHGSHTHNK